MKSSTRNDINKFTDLISAAKFIINDLEKNGDNINRDPDYRSFMKDVSSLTSRINSMRSDIK